MKAASSVPSRKPGTSTYAHALLGALLCAHTASAWALTVKPPCKESLGWNHVLRTCNDVLNGVPGTTALSGPGYIAEFKQTVQNRVNDWYAHRDGTAKLPESMVWCNLVDNPFVPPGDGTAAVPGNPKNHVDDSCGRYSQITVNIHLSLFMGCVVGGGWQTMVNNTPPNATIEGSYMRSGEILANSCYLDKFTAQTRAYAVDIAQDSSCMAAAQDVLKMEDMLHQYDALKYDVNCLENWDTTQNSVGVTQGRDKNASQQICALRAQVETGFAKLVDCEINDRSIKKYLREIGGAQAQEDLFHAIDQQITQVCGSSCASHFSACGNVPTTGPFSACANTCYQQNLAPFMKKYLQQHFGSCE